MSTTVPPLGPLSFLLYLFLVSTMWQMLTNPSRASEGGSLNTASTALCAQEAG